ncbi:MAG: photosynthetic reaction center subunit H [Sphingomonadales bacterium]|uniref:photosynthetic reaction center subunit H n=1 Tax=Novosphingobium sp. NDB2Meth1 TaxID=1892847 RepID=UPI000931646C|nr:photosynthetic reaction center subunit H [Novosphingobium sp. NDB2Meth1]MBU6396040.1 photosynthetic reaction center subunit H [Sphingomonadales bacterium]
MKTAYVVGSIDVAEIALWAFFLFFVALVFWLRREDRREGYPLEDEINGFIESVGGPLSTALPKTFRLPFDRGTVSYPLPREEGREPVDIAAKRYENFPGAPYVPTGNPLVDGVGPASYANRAKWPDQDAHGRARIVPLSTEDHISVWKGGPDPRGMKVTAADGKVAGTVTDLWIDRAEHQVRYLQVETASGKTVLAPMAMASVSTSGVNIDAINAADYDAVPQLASATEITRYEEERVIGYFGGGYLYANAGRQEPIL